MLDSIQDRLDSVSGQLTTIIVFLGLFSFSMYYTIYVLRPLILDGGNQQHCEESE